MLENLSARWTIRNQNAIRLRTERKAPSNILCSVLIVGRKSTALSFPPCTDTLSLFLLLCLAWKDGGERRDWVGRWVLLARGIRRWEKNQQKLQKRKLSTQNPKNEEKYIYINCEFSQNLMLLPTWGKGGRGPSAGGIRSTHEEEHSRNALTHTLSLPLLLLFFFQGEGSE